MHIQSAIALYAGGTGSGCNPAAGKCGRNSTRALLARRSHVPVTAAKLLVSKENERAVAAAVDGISTKNNSPFDVIAGKIGIEVKTVFPDVKHDKITMHPDSRERKMAESKKLKLKTFTVAFEQKSNKIYWAPGLKSFRLRNMQVTTLKNLKAVLK